MNKAEALGRFLENPEIVKLSKDLTVEEEIDLVEKLKCFLLANLSNYEYLRSRQEPKGCCGVSDRQTCCKNGAGNSPAIVNLPPQEDSDWTLQTK